METCSSLKIGLLAGAFGLALVSSSADAQNYGPYGPLGYQGQGPESVQIYGQRFRVEGGRLNNAPDKVSLSTKVDYSDLNLRTRRGAWELRQRVRMAAWDTCAQLAEGYPFYEANGTDCYKTALQNALLHADEAIVTARDYRSYGD